VRSFRPTHLEQLVPELEGLGTPLFLGMRAHHIEALAAWPEHAQRGILLLPGEEIGDPVLEGADFARTFRQVAAGVDALLAELAGDGGGSVRMP
jgi:hypothetical protein